MKPDVSLGPTSINLTEPQSLQNFESSHKI